MDDRHRRQWESLGRIDPYWAVLTEPSKKGGRWDAPTFFASGEREIEEAIARARALGLHPSDGLALDYGCGVGRLSRALAARFRSVIGVDFSESMLSEAARANAGVPNLRFERNDGRSLAMVPDGTVDFVYSVIALQHSPPEAQRAVLREFARVLAPGGIAVFQTPSRPDTGTLPGLAYRLLGNRLLNLPRLLVHGRGRVMEVHSLPREAVVLELEAGGLAISGIDRHDVAGPAFESYRYFARKA